MANTVPTAPFHDAAALKKYFESAYESGQAGRSRA